MNGYKLIGKCGYFTTDEWVDRVKALPENKGMPSKRALLITVEKIIKSA